MKKTIFIASVLLASAATVGIAQLSDGVSAKQTIPNTHAFNAYNFQDTTKPKKDTSGKDDSTTIRLRAY